MPAPFEVIVPAELKPLLPRFLERTGAELVRLRAALEAGDTAALQAIGHKLRGSAGGYGFHHLGELAKRLEETAKTGSAAACAGLVAEMSDHMVGVQVVYR